MSQTTVDTKPALGIPGQLATFKAQDDASVASKQSFEASASIPFGVFVKDDSAANGDDAVKLITTTADLLAGVTVFSQNFNHNHQVDANGDIVPGVFFGVLEEGDIFVLVEDAVTPASEVHVRAIIGGTNGYGAAGAENHGAVRGTADSTDCIDVTSIARFKTSADAGGIAVLSWRGTTNRGLALADT